jgi:hypothetical protein
MHTDHDIKNQTLANAWAALHAHANSGEALRKDSYRLAFADPEFLMRNETRGMRLQLEMAKPDLIQQALGVDHTIVVFGSARFKDQATADALKQGAQASGDVAAQAGCSATPATMKLQEALPTQSPSTAKLKHQITACSFVQAGALALWRRPTVARQKPVRQRLDSTSPCPMSKAPTRMYPPS